MEFTLGLKRQLVATFAVVVLSTTWSAMAVAQIESDAQTSRGLPDAKSIVDRFIEVSHLAHMVENTSYRHSKGWIEFAAFGLEGSFDSYWGKPNRYVNRINFEGLGLVVKGVAGSTGWSLNPMESDRLLKGGELLTEVLQSAYDAPMHLKSRFEMAETIGREDFDGVECYKVKFVANPLPGMDKKLSLRVRTSYGYFEVESGLKRGRVELVGPPTGAVEVVTVTTDYKSFEGTLFSTKIRQEFQGVEVLLGIESIDFEDVEDSLFEMPPSIKTLHAATLTSAAPPKTTSESVKAPTPESVDEQASSSGKPTPKGTSSRKPSVLFYLIDTCRADRMGIHDAPHFTTPFLSELSKRSVVFENCNSQAPWTKPSMAAILTSRYPSEVGMTRMFATLSSDLVTFPEVLAEHGWHTAGFSANPIMGRMSNYIQGFDEFVESSKINAADPIRYASGSARKLNEKVFEWLGSNQAWPNFLYVHSVDPHEEYEPDPVYLREFGDPDRMDEYRKQWKALLKSRPNVPGNYVTQSNFDRAGVDADSFVEYGKNLYDADILANDAEIGHLWRRLAMGTEEAGEASAWGDDMIVVVTSDHGEEFLEHGGTCHGYSLYQELIHVPLMIFAPGLLPEGVRIEQPVASIDIYPTLLDLLDLDAPPGLRGRSLLPLIRNPKDTQATSVYSELTEDPVGRLMGSGTGIGLSVIEGRWKFILSLRPPQVRKRARYELFDRLSDPKETHNVAMDHPELVGRLEQHLLDWSASNLGLVTADDVASQDIDAESLEALRNLGYISDESPEDLVSSGRRLLPGLTRAVLDGDQRWKLVALDPNRGSLKEGAKEKTFRGFTILDRGFISADPRDKLAAALFRGLAQGQSHTSKDGLSPRLGIEAEFRGHTTSLILAHAQQKIQVYVDDLLLSELTCPLNVIAEIESLAKEVGVAPPEK